MEFTELADHPLPRGELTEWTPTVAADRWYRDERPLAYTHEEHCRHSLATTPARGGSAAAAWIGAVFEVHERFDVDALRRALRAWTSRHETFRSTVTVDAESELTRWTVPADAVDVASRRVGRCRSGSEVHERISAFFDRTLSPFRWPHCVVTTIDDPGPADEIEKFLLVFGADHSVMDAYSMLLAVSELRRLYEFELHGRDPKLPDTGSHVDFAVQDRRAGDEISVDHHVVQTWRSFLSDGRFPAFPLPLGVPGQDGPERQSSVSRMLLDADAVDTLARRARADGASMTAAVVAALALTTREMSGRDRMRVTMPMHTRFEPRFAESVGWYVGVVPVDVRLDEDSDLSHAFGRAQRSLDAVKGYARAPYSRVARLLGLDSVPEFVVSYLDLRHTPDAQSWPAWNTRTLRSATPTCDEVYFWVLRTPLGLGVAARFPGHDSAVRTVHGFLDHVHHVLLDAAGVDAPTLGTSASRTTNTSVSA